LGRLHGLWKRARTSPSERPHGRYEGRRSRRLRPISAGGGQRQSSREARKAAGSRLAAGQVGERQRDHFGRLVQIGERQALAGPGFAEMLERLLGNGARTIIVESPDRFARDLMVQLAATTC